MPEGYAEKIKQRDPVGSDDWVYRRGDIYIANLAPTMAGCKLLRSDMNREPENV